MLIYRVNWSLPKEQIGQTFSASGAAELSRVVRRLGR